ncbi:glutathione S-transferase [Rhodotorula toruloides]|uniref:Glutathione S-transferase n=1 Tax=Rhodotorula toruloides TaxID=5286 RepID=A0A511KI69_RHOTO|nr:glutathione S-transferase [Rhodotorula toruloides]
MELVYWAGIRGLAYPIQLFLESHSIEYTYTPIKYDRNTWPVDKRAGKLDLKEIPFQCLPVLKVKDEESGETVALGETHAILRYLEAKYGRQQELSLITQARVDALFSHAEFFVERTFYRSASPTWLDPPKRDETIADVYMPFLRSMEHALQDEKTVEALWHKSGDGLRPSAAACFVAAAFTMLTDIMPFSFARSSTLKSKKNGGQANKTLASQFPACDQLVTDVEACPGVQKWFEGVTDEWSLSPPFAAHLVREAAERWDKVGAGQ